MTTFDQAKDTPSTTPAAHATIPFMPPTEVAKRIRVALRKNFPGVKFSVQTDKYAGGASINVSYDNAGTEESDVEAVTNNYVGTAFDSMQDYSSHVVSSSKGDGMFYSGADHVFVRNRSIYGY